MTSKDSERIIPKIILILGSYDPETKTLLYRVKEYICISFTEDIYPLLLEEVEMYRCTDDHLVLVERIDNMCTVHIYKTPLGLKDIYSFECEDYTSTLENILLERYDIEVKEKVPVLEKLNILARISELTFIIRDKELTRGGEYVELTFLLDQGLDPRDVYFLVNRSIGFSSMLKELLDCYNFNFRVYSNVEELLEEVHRIIYYRVIKGREEYSSSLT